MGILKRHIPPRPRKPSSANFSEKWQIFSPVAYRYLDSRYVDAFFEDGTLRLTTFTKCRKHADEQRLDVDEGTIRIALSDPQSGDIRAVHTYQAGANAFVLCTALWHNAGLMKEFGCDSFFRIHDPAEFGARVSAHVAGFVSGAEGPCMYHHNRLLESAMEPSAPSPIPKPTMEAAGFYSLFLKHKAYSHQAEYRLVWLTAGNLEVEHLDVKVPEARELCSRPGAFEFEEYPLGKNER